MKSKGLTLYPGDENDASSFSRKSEEEEDTLYLPTGTQQVKVKTFYNFLNKYLNPPLRCVTKFNYFLSSIFLLLNYLNCLCKSPN